MAKVKMCVIGFMLKITPRPSMSFFTKENLEKFITSEGTMSGRILIWSECCAGLWIKSSVGKKALQKN